MNTDKNFTDRPIWNLIRDNSPSIVGAIGISVLIMAAILNLAGFVSGLDFFALFVLSFTIMLVALGMMDGRRENMNEGHNRDVNIS